MDLAPAKIDIGKLTYEYLLEKKKYKDQLPQKFQVKLEKTYGLSKIIFGKFPS